jgi:hypothetical protein
MRRTVQQDKKKPNKRLAATYIDGQAVCPVCQTRHFGGIVEYGLADANHRDIGMFKFVVNCKDCGNKIVYYKDM